MRGTTITIRKRLTGVFILASLFFFILIGRLAWIQFVHGEELEQKALDVRMRDVPVEAKRGSIYDRNGEELVTSISVDSIYVIPGQVKNPRETAEKLAPLLGMETEKVYEIITSKSSFRWLKRKFRDYQAVQKIKELKLPGINFVEESTRFYPHEDLASHVLGITGIDNQGLAGIELGYDEELRGVPGRIVVEYDAAGRKVPEALHRYFPPQQGNHLVLTLDETIQYFVERELDKIVETYKPRLAVIIVMDPKTGEILAMGNRPTFNPNNWMEASDKVWNRNPAIWYNYEPGSTFKIITAAAALEEGVVKPADRFYDPGYIEVAGRRIRCWKDGGHGSQSFEEVIQNSCNPGFIEVGLELGRERFYKYIRAFGFGQRTGIDLIGEQAGIVIPEEKATNLNIATMSIGQSIAVTPIQLAAAVSAVANDGVLMKPRVVREIRNEKGEVVKRYKPEKVRQVISRETSVLLRNLLEKVVVDGTGKNAYVEGYRVAGKTGTAQVVSEKGGYESGKYVSSFVGFAPVDDPKVTILVVIAEPQGGVYYGGVVAAPVFQAVARDTLRYLQIPENPDLKGPEQPGGQPAEVERNHRAVITVPEVVNCPVVEAERRINGAGLNVRLVGEGELVCGQTPEGGARVEAGTTVVLELQPNPSREDGGLVTVPDMTGVTIKEAASLLEDIGLRLNPEGSGLAVGQDIKPGKKVPRGTTVKIKFAPPDQSSVQEGKKTGR